MSKTFLAAAAALSVILAACSTTSGPPAFEPHKLDTGLTKACPDPVPIPSRDLTEEDVVKLWGMDRIALADCAKRFGLAIGIVEKRDAAIGAAAR